MEDRKKKELQRIEESKSVIVHEEKENSVEDNNESETDHLVEFRDNKERGKKRKRLTKSEMSDLRCIWRSITDLKYRTLPQITFILLSVPKLGELQ